MLGKVVAMATLVVTGVLTGAPPGQAGTGSTAAQPVPRGWYDTNGNAAQSRANPVEKILSPSAVSRVTYLRTITSAPASASAPCGQQAIVAPLPYDNDLYVVAGGKVSKYDPATGALAWQQPVNKHFISTALDISANILVVGATGCESASEPGGIVAGFNATTGMRLWATYIPGGGPLNDVVKVSSYVIVAGEDAAGYQVSVFKVANGKSVWKAYGCTGFGFPPALVVDSLVMTYGCTSAGNTTIEARTLATGSKVWSLRGSWTLQRGDLSGPSGRHLYARNPKGTVVDLDPATGHVGYSLSDAKKVLAVDTSRVYATCGASHGDVCAYSIATGALLWRRTAPYYDPPARAAEADGVLYLDSGAALNASTGKVITTIWQGEFKGGRATELAVGNGRIAVSTDPRTLDLYGLPGS